VDTSKVGALLAGDIRVYSMDDLPRIAAEKEIEIAIVTTPGNAAQGAVDRIVAAGIKGILNFAPVQLQVPESVKVKKVDLTTEFDNLVYHLYARAH